jgi:hypothetical protein
MPLAIVQLIHWWLLFPQVPQLTCTPGLQLTLNINTEFLPLMPMGIPSRQKPPLS